jgi:hypothetical protein
LTAKIDFQFEFVKWLAEAGSRQGLDAPVRTLKLRLSTARRLPTNLMTASREGARIGQQLKLRAGRSSVVGVRWSLGVIILACVALSYSGSLKRPRYSFRCLLGEIDPVWMPGRTVGARDSRLVLITLGLNPKYYHKPSESSSLRSCNLYHFQNPNSFESAPTLH